jgi:two-component system, LytTR family, response regulator
MTSASKLRVLIVDDEAPARRKILRLLRQELDVQVVGEADGAEEAIAAIDKNKPELVFLDVQMPGADGFDVVAAIPPENMPRVIFVTAHDRFALKAFEVHAFDYLLKPFSEERLRAALERARKERTQPSDGLASQLQQLVKQLQKERSFPQHILVQENGRAYFVAARDIAWAEANGNYVQLHCGPKTHTLRGTLEAMRDVLDPKAFVRINRSSVVNLEAIREMQPWFHGEYKVVLKDGKELRWSRRYVKDRPELVRGSKDVRK